MEKQLAVVSSGPHSQKRCQKIAAPKQQELPKIVCDIKEINLKAMILYLWDIVTVSANVLQKLVITAIRNRILCVFLKLLNNNQSVCTMLGLSILGASTFPTERFS